MQINNIKGFLERFKNLKPSDTYIKEIFIEVIKDVVGVELTKEEMKVQGETIFLQTHPALKSEIFLQKNVILKSLEERLKKHSVKNIV